MSTELKTNISPPGWASCLSRGLGSPGRVRKHAVRQRGRRAALKDSERFRSSTRTDCSRGGKVNPLPRSRGCNHWPPPRRLASWPKFRRSLITAVLAIVDVDAPPALLVLDAARGRTMASMTGLAAGPARPQQWRSAAISNDRPPTRHPARGISARRVDGREPDDPWTAGDVARSRAHAQELALACPLRCITPPTPCLIAAANLSRL